LYGFEGRPFLLPTFVCDHTLFPRSAGNTKHGPPFFDKKRKRQFISMPFNVANVTIRSLSHLNKVFEMLNAFNLKEVEPLKGFDPEGLFYDHLASMRYNNIFIRIAKGIDDNDPNTPGRKKNKYVMMIWLLKSVQILNVSNRT
jgi:hypothetical protein